MSDSHHIETIAIHAGESQPNPAGAVVTPIFQSANYLSANEQDYKDIKYIRLNNSPNHEVLHRKLACLESGEDALVTASGMAAISTALLANFGSGDHLLVQNGLYGGTHSLLTEDLPKLGIEVSFFDSWMDVDLEALVRPNTKGIYVESMSNPALNIPRFAEIVAFAKAKQLISIIDNTFATPVNFRPLDIGFDLVVHSATKYLNGHSDIVAGVIVGNAERINRARKTLSHYGGSLDPHACFLLQRGLKTLPLRVKQQNQSALQLADFLDHHNKVRDVKYAGLASHPHHDRAKHYFSGFSGMLSFEYLGQLTDLFERLTIPLVAVSLGGVESLITVPAKSSHLGVPAAERRAMGISDTLVRVSVGIESADDLVVDFDQAMR